MENNERKSNKGLKAILILALLFVALFFGALIYFGVLGSGVEDLFNNINDNFEPYLSFDFTGGSIAIKTAISGLIYLLLAINVIFVIVGCVRIGKTKRFIPIFGLIDAYLALIAFVYAGLSAGQLWAAIRDNNDSQIAALLVIFLIVLALFFAYLGLILSFREARLHPKQKAAVEEDPEAVLFEEVEPALLNDETNEDKTVNAENNNKLTDDLRDLIREILKEELAKSNNNSPLIVQYINGQVVNNGQCSCSEISENVKEEPSLPEEEKANDVEEKPAEPAPIAEEKQEEIVAPVEEENVEKKPIIRIPFTDRMLSADADMQRNYNELKNEILSYGVNSRVSNSGDTFRLHRKTYVKLTIAGLSLKLYFALDPNDYKDSTIPVQDAGHKGIYEEIPLVFKVKSGLSMRRCKQLIQDVMEKNGLEQGEVGHVDWVNELKNKVNDDDDKD